MKPRPGQYERTEKVRDIQRSKMKERIKEYDFNEIDKKRKATIKLRKVKVGRKKILKTFSVECKTCNKFFDTENSSRKYCSKDCYYISRKGKLVVPENFDYYNRNIDYKKRSEKNIRIVKGFKKYQYEVRKLTEINYSNNIDLINPNRLVRKPTGQEDGYHLDHIISIKECWNLGKTVEQASAIENLQILPWKDNLKKRKFDKIIEREGEIPL